MMKANRDNVQGTENSFNAESQLSARMLASVASLLSLSLPQLANAAAGIPVGRIWIRIRITDVHYLINK